MGRGITVQPKATYLFKLDNVIYKRSTNSGVNKDVVIGDKYLIFFDKSNYKKEMILFDKPIKDSIDFEQYKKEFNRKTPRWDQVNIKPLENK